MQRGFNVKNGSVEAEDSLNARSAQKLRCRCTGSDWQAWVVNYLHAGPSDASRRTDGPEDRVWINAAVKARYLLAFTSSAKGVY